MIPSLRLFLSDLFGKYAFADAEELLIGAVTAQRWTDVAFGSARMRPGTCSCIIIVTISGGGGV